MAKVYNQFASDDNVDVINAKLETGEYDGLTDKEILIELNRVGIFILAPYEVLDGKVVRTAE